MTLSKGFVTTAATNSVDMRLLEQGLLVKNVGDVPRAGLLYGDIAPVKATSATAPMTVSIADQTVFAVTRGNTDGVSIITNVGVATVQLAAAPSANSRYDVIYAKQNDTEKGDANSNPVFDKVTGQANASPVVPAAPAGALVLATVLIPAGVTATTASGVVITNLVPATALFGSPVRYRTVAEMVADVPNVIDGTEAYIKGGGIFYLRSGIWRRQDNNSYVRVVQSNSTTITTGTSPGTLGGTSPVYEVSDSQYFDSRTDGVVGPAKVAGWYDVTAQVTWGSNQSGERFLEITNNDTSAVPPIADRRPAAATNVGTSSSNTATGQSFQSITGQVYLNVGEYVKLKGWQNSGATISYISRLMVKPMATV